MNYFKSFLRAELRSLHAKDEKDPLYYIDLGPHPSPIPPPSLSLSSGRGRYNFPSLSLQAPGFENWSYTVDNVDGALQVRTNYESGKDTGSYDQISLIKT